MQFNKDIALFTCSYGPDFERCRRLCVSVDQHVADKYEHVVVVPRRDLDRFASLASSRRRVLSTESILPSKYIQLPFTNKWWIDSRGWPIRGWIMQQLTKMSACFATEATLIMHVDSDIQFIRDLNPDRLFKNATGRLNRRAGAKSTGEHLKWHQVASNLLGLEPRYSGADYIGPLTTWRNDHLRDLLKHIEETNNTSWYYAVGHKLWFSEYILYGQFIERVLKDKHQHFMTESYDCYCVWTEEDMKQLGSGDQSLALTDIAILIQSNLSMSQEEEQNFLDSSAPRSDEGVKPNLSSG